MANEKKSVELTLTAKLMVIQSELKAPKGQYNSFGKFKYRSCEDILEAVKPLCIKYATLLTIDDEIVLIGDRYYVKATATLADCESESYFTVSAFAREADNKSGMDSAQVTGATSSYARKYALNGLFCIDDTKDADTDEYTSTARQQAKPEPKAKPKAKATPKSDELTYRDKVMIVGEEKGMTPKQLAEKYGLTRNTTEERFAEVLADLEGRK